MSKELDDLLITKAAELTHRIHVAIDEFNTYFDGCEHSFLFGNCYWYARILQERFSPWFETEIMYNQVMNHFCCRLSTAAGYFYADVSGVIGVGDSSGNLEGWKPWKDRIAIEPLDSARVYRDCIWHLDEDQWEQLPQSFRETPWDLGKSVVTEK